MIFIVTNLLDFLILIHALHWMFSIRPFRNNPLTGFINKVCAPSNRILSQFIQLNFKGSAVPPSALTILCFTFLRIAFSALY